MNRIGKPSNEKTIGPHRPGAPRQPVVGGGFGVHGHQGSVVVLCIHRPGAPWQAVSDLVEVEIAVEAERTAVPVAHD